MALPSVGFAGILTSILQPYHDPVEDRHLRSLRYRVALDQVTAATEPEVVAPMGTWLKCAVKKDVTQEFLSIRR